MNQDLIEAEIKFLRDRVLRLELLQEELLSTVKRERINALDFRDKIFLFLFVIFIFLCSGLMMQDEVDEDTSAYDEYVDHDEDASGFSL